MTTGDDELKALKAENARLRGIIAQRGLSEVAAQRTSAETAFPEARSAPPSSSSEPTLPTSHECGPHSLSADAVARYSRQIILPSFGVQGQQRLCSGSVLVVGAGGLGCPAAMYLAAAGVGRLGLLDRDEVDRSNLHRQVLHREQDVGRHKAASAAAACRALNSSIQVVEHLDGLTQENAVGLVMQYDVIVDASDNAPTRYLVKYAARYNSDACVACDKPLVFGAAIGTDGQLTVYHYGEDGPCYRCIFPECPAPANCSRCVDAGVLGPVPGVIGVMQLVLQAVEAIKILSGRGNPLSQRLLLYDALTGRVQVVKLRGRRDDCIVCGSQPRITQDNLHTYDYAAFTGQAPHDQAEQLQLLPREQRITAQQLHQLLREQSTPTRLLLLDTRPPHQFDIARLVGSINVPFDSLDGSLSKAQELISGAQAGAETGPRADADALHCVVVCRRGNDSQVMVQRLRQLGVQGVKDLVGGLNAWAAHCDDSFPSY